ncbi:MAG: HIT domain-containing protein [Candidatus Saccharimonadales bacterium]
MPELTPQQQQKQELYRDARLSKKYNDIWQSVGKCAFCDLKDKYIFFEEAGVVMTISLYAYIDGHFMIIPRRHVKSAKELTQKEWETVRKFLYIAKKLIKSVHHVNGMQLVQKDGSGAQSTVEHLHFHCVPFDSPDLSQWNYRKLKNTPLENAELYKEAGKKIIRADLKFTQKYRNPTGVKVVCDAIIIDDKKQILFEERKAEYRLEPDYLTLPGGAVQNFDVSLPEELAREVKEETGYKINPKQAKLISSRVDSATYPKMSAQLAINYNQEEQFLRNTYVIHYEPSKTILRPADDAKKLIWIPLDKVATHSRISPTTKQILKEATL